nr:hypothetical protein [uncultured Halomonas sp.]
MSTIVTHSGRVVSLLEPSSSMIDAEDIGRALSRICRFGGHTREHYSVAQHCVLASHWVPAAHQLTALMHDATEAYVGDIVSPLKALIPAFKHIEARFWTAIATRFALPVDMPACIHDIDLILLATERRDLLCDDAIWPHLEGVTPLTAPIEPWSMDHAYDQWMTRFEQLNAQRHDTRMLKVLVEKEVAHG